MEHGQFTDGNIKRPDFFKFLCILSFIGSGLSAFSNLVIYLAFDTADDYIDELIESYPGLDAILAGGKGFFLAGFILYSISFFGVIQMWKLKKIGFHFYTGAQIFILLLPVMTLEAFQLSFLSILITLAFIIGYYSQLKYMP